MARIRILFLENCYLVLDIVIDIAHGHKNCDLSGMCASGYWHVHLAFRRSWKTVT